MDWSAPVEELRAELRRVCEGSELWNGRVCVLQVTEATGGMVRLRALVSADDAGALWDLRCLIRERLVAFLRDHEGGRFLPRTRVALVDAEPPASGRDGAEPVGSSPAASDRTGSGGPG